MGADEIRHRPLDRWLPPRRTTGWILVGTLVLYAGSFPVAHQVIDHYYFVAGILPIVAAGLLLGFRAAVATVLAISVVHFGVLTVGLQRPLYQAAVDSLPLVTLLIGGAIGYLRDLRVELERRRAELEHTNQQLTREQELKDTVREVLIDLSDRRDIEQSLCSRLQNDGYRLVCLYEETAIDGLSPRYCARTDDCPEDAASALTADTAPPARAIERGNSVWIDDANDYDAEWAEAAMAAGIRSMLAVPLGHNGIEYGVLCVCDSDVGTFDQQTRGVLEKIAETLAYAINDTYRRDALRSEQPLEITVAVWGTDSYLFDLARSEWLSAGGTVSVIETDAPGTATVYQHLEFEGGVPADVESIIRADPDVESIARESPSGLPDAETIRVELEQPTIVDGFVDVGAAVRSICVSEDRVTITARISPDADLGTVIDGLRASFSKVDLLRKSQVGTEDSITPAALADDLTDKQLEALRLASAHGFFDRPQGKTADEIASLLGVSRQTFLTHVRAAESTLIEEFVAGRSSMRSIEATADD